MFVIKVLVQLTDGSFDSLPIAKYGDVEWDEKEPDILQWKTSGEAHSFAERNLPGMACLIEEDVEKNTITDDQPYPCTGCYTCTGCNTAPCDCHDELITNTGSLR